MAIEIAKTLGEFVAFVVFLLSIWAVIETFSGVVS